MQSAMSLKRRPDETDDVMDIDDCERLLYDARFVAVYAKATPPHAL